MNFRINKLKYLVIFFAFAILMLCNKAVFGYNLTLQAKLDSVTGELYFQEYMNAADESRKQWANFQGDYAAKYRDAYGWVSRDNFPSLASFNPSTATTGSFSITDFFFYKDSEGLLTSVGGLRTAASTFSSGGYTNSNYVDVSFMTASGNVAYYEPATTPNMGIFGYGTGAVNFYNDSSKMSKILSYAQSISTGTAKHKFKIINYSTGAVYTLADYNAGRTGIYLIEYKLTNAEVSNLRSYLGLSGVGAQTIRFSGKLITTKNTYARVFGFTSSTKYSMYTANQFYGVTQMSQGVTWTPYTKGTDSWYYNVMTNASKYATGSGMNLYDNRLVIPGTTASRKIYVRHRDAATGALIAGIGNAKSVDGISVISPVPAGYSEYYEIAPTSAITVAKSAVNSVNGYPLSYKGYRASTNTDKNTAIANLAIQGGYNGSTTKTVTASGQPDYTFVDFYYDIVAPPPPVDLLGKLSFLSPDASYQPTTSGSDDYIATEKTLTGGVSGAYPFLLKNFSYRTQTDTIDIYYQPPDVPTLDPLTNTTVMVTPSKIFKGSVKLTYCRVEKIGLFTIDKAVLHDYDTNVGGKLFDREDDITLSTSSSYINRSSVQFNGGGTSSDYNPSTRMNDIITVENDSVVINGVQLLSPATVSKQMSPGSSVNITANYDTLIPTIVKPAADTSTNDFSTVLTIPRTKVNGTRNPYVTLYYKTDQYNYIAGNTIINPSVPSYVVNTMEKTFTAGNDTVTVHNPITLVAPKVISGSTVNHSDGTIATSAVIQRNSDFTVTPLTAKAKVPGYSNVATQPFVDHYYVMFDFDVNDVRIYKSGDGTGALIGSNPGVVPANTPIRISSGTGSLVATTTNDFGSTALAQFTNRMRVIAVGINAPPGLDNIINSFEDTNGFNAVDYQNGAYEDYEYIKQKSGGATTGQNSSGLIRQDLYNAAYHAVRFDISTNNLGRIYDFKITDCSDVNFKDVFRKTNANNVNEITGNAYYTGLNYWNTYSLNEMLRRPTTEIGTNPLKILPLGPYKHDPATYINAPKLGYRISFDVKTNGYMTTSAMQLSKRRIEITPTYYYISKTGGTPDFNIKLMYKNSAGVYQAFDSSNYTIYFKPNDGYRNILNKSTTPNDNFMSKNLIPLVIGSNTGTFALDYTMMNYSNDGFIQSWYGEFKLPNSLIVCAKNPNGTANINAQKADGYVGVIFKLVAIDNNNGVITKMSYSANDISAASQTNTTQWDYEGFLGFANPGSAVPAAGLRLQLEKGLWFISNDIYTGVGTTPGIKGTVVLYDLDARASDDFE